MNKNKILDKIKKMKAIINDRAAPEGEKEVARAAIDRILNKYPDIDYIDKTDEEEIINYVKTKDQYERDILIMICFSYGVDSYTEKYKSKLTIKIYSTQTLFDLILEEFEYHRSIIQMQLKVLTAAYAHQFIYKPTGEGREATKEENQAYSNAASFFRTQNFYNKLRIEEWFYEH